MRASGRNFFFFFFFSPFATIRERVHVPSCKLGQSHRIAGNSLLISGPAAAVRRDTRDGCQMNQSVSGCTTTNNPITSAGGLRDDSCVLSDINN